jgi:general secretion pathway protein G
MRRRSGFTLIELIIVVSIIAFLGVLVVGYLRSQVYKGNDAKRKAEIKRIGIAVEEYEKDNNCYPTTVTCAVSDSLQPYLNSIPCDPVLKTSYYYEHDGTSCPKWYRLYADLDNERDEDYLPNIGPSSAYSYYQSSPNAPAMVIGGGSGEVTGFVGCKSGVCTNISIDPISGEPECAVNYGGTNCLQSCGSPSAPLNECVAQ